MGIPRLFSIISREDKCECKKNSSISNIDQVVDSIFDKSTLKSKISNDFNKIKRLSLKKSLSIILSFILIFAVIASASSLVDSNFVNSVTNLGGINLENTTISNYSEHFTSNDSLFDNSTISNNQNLTEEIISNSTRIKDNETDEIYDLSFILTSNKNIYFIGETINIKGYIFYNDTFNETSVNLYIIGPGYDEINLINISNREFFYEFLPNITGIYYIEGKIFFNNSLVVSNLSVEVINNSQNQVVDETPNIQETQDIADNLEILGSPFDTFVLPSKSMGPSHIKVINPDYFWTYFERYSGWYLEAWDKNTEAWIDVTDYLDVKSNRSSNNKSEKISLEFIAPFSSNYKLSYRIEKPLKFFINKSNEFEYELIYAVGDNEEYRTFFNYSDIASLPDVIITHGVKEINGDDMFWFSVQKNNISEGTKVIIDPIFGYTGTSYYSRDGDDIPGGYFQMGAVGGMADNITAYFSTAGQPNSGRAAIYDISGSLLTNGVTNENTAIGDGWEIFIFSPRPILQANAWYYLVVFTDSSKSDLQYDIVGGNGLYVDLGETYPNFPDPYAATQIDSDAIVSIYCSYSEFDVDPPTPDPLTWNIEPYNVSSNSITMIATTASDINLPINYFFNETSGNSGGNDSGWQVGTTFTDYGLSENTQYGYEVKARDNNATPNEGNYSTPISYEYTSVDPPIDSELSFAISTTWINATVVSPPNPNSGSTGSNFSWITGGILYSDWQNGIYYHNRTGLTENTNYGCRVQYCNGDAEASSFNPTEKTNYTLCVPPTDGEFTIDSYGRNWINMSVAHPTNPLIGFTAAYFECVTGGASDSGWITTSSAGRYNYNITGLISDTIYGFRVKYRNAESEETSYTSEKQQQTDPPIAPTVFTNTSIGVEETNATLKGWLQDNGSADTTCYFLLNDTNDFGIPILNLSKGIIANGAEFENDTAGKTTLTKGKLYYYKALGNNSGGWDEGSVQLFLTKPQNISSFTATMIGATQIDLSWIDETGGDGAYIEYAIGIAPSPWSEGDGTPVDADGNVTSPFSHIGLEPGSRYYYKAWAYATDGGWTSTGNQSAPRGNPQTDDEATTGPPSVLTNATIGIEETNATLKGYLLSNGTLDTTCYFLWGIQNPPTDNNVSQGLIGHGAEFSYDTSLTGPLTKGTLYYVDTKAYNLGGWNESGGVVSFLTKPDPPNNLIVQTNSSSVIYLSWNNGIGYNTTYIERNASSESVWSLGEGTMIYNGTGTYFEDTGLLEGVTYYYQAWSYANWIYDSTLLYQWSDTNSSNNNNTNNIPTITNEVPANGSTDQNVPIQLSITVNDFEGDSMIITWYSNSSGTWKVFGSNITGIDGNGTYYQTNSNFSNYHLTYYWNVSVSDGKDTNNSGTFHFETKDLFTLVNTITPYIVTSSPKTITATGDSSLDQVSLYYRWSYDNQSWESWDLLTFDGFEDAAGDPWVGSNYTDGGDDCILDTSGSWSHEGSNAANIQDGSGVPSSFYHTNGIDVDSPDYKCIKIDFWFIANGMGDGHDFMVEYWNGGSWDLVATYVAGTDFLNRQFYNEIVWINESTYNFPVDMQIRFRNGAHNNNNDVYIDEIYVKATTQSAGGNGVNWTFWNNVNNPDTASPWSWEFDFPHGTGYYEFYCIGNKSGSDDENPPISADAKCRFNRLPTIENEIPANQSTNIQLIPLMNITINDLDGDTMTIIWYSNSSGSWQVFGTNSSVGNGTYYQSNSNFSVPGETYWWNVSVNDGIHTNDSNIFYFKTSYAPTLSNPGPSNGTTGEYTTPTCNVTVSDQDGGTVIVRFYENTTGSWILQQTNSSVDVTIPSNVIWNNFINASRDFTMYWWKVNVSDGKGNYVEEVYHFTTANVTIEVTPSQWDIGLIPMDGSNETTSFYFNLTNQGDVTLHIQINASNATNSSTGAIWRLNATPDFDNFTLQYNKSDSGTWTNINLTFDTFLTNLEVGSWQTFDLKLLTATKATYGDPLTLTITFRSVKA